MRDLRREKEFSDYVRAQRSRLLRTARLLCAGDEQSAEDLVQTTLTSLFVHWTRVNRADDPVAYGFKALTNAFLDERRRAHRKREVLHGFPVEPTTRSAETTELRHVVLAALAGLPPRQRAVVVLRQWLDLEVATTAELLGCSPGTVKSQQSKALDHLRATLSPELLTERQPHD